MPSVGENCHLMGSKISHAYFSLIYTFNQIQYFHFYKEMGLLCKILEFCLLVHIDKRYKYPLKTSMYNFPFAFYENYAHIFYQMFIWGIKPMSRCFFIWPLMHENGMQKLSLKHIWQFWSYWVWLPVWPTLKSNLFDLRFFFKHITISRMLRTISKWKIPV